MNNLATLPPIPFSFDSAGTAIAALPVARALCLKASYHPLGGETAVRNIDPTHVLWVEGTPAQVEAFKTALVKRSETHHE